MIQSAVHVRLQPQDYSVSITSSSSSSPAFCSPCSFSWGLSACASNGGQPSGEEGKEGKRENQKKMTVQRTIQKHTLCTFVKSKKKQFPPHLLCFYSKSHRTLTKIYKALLLVVGVAKTTSHYTTHDTHFSIDRQYQTPPHTTLPKQSVALPNESGTYVYSSPLSANAHITY